MEIVRELTRKEWRFLKRVIKWQWLPLTFVVCLVIITVANAFTLELSKWGDNAQFIVLAKSIVAGTGMREINHPDKPVHTKYPVGYPFILATCEWISPGNLFLMKIVTVIFFVASCILLWFLIRHYSDDLIATLITCLFTTNALALHFSSIIMSEVPYIFFSILTLWLLTQSNTKNRWYFPMAIPTCLAAYYIRSAGISLIAAMILYLCITKQYKRTATFLGCVILIKIIEAVFLKTSAESGEYLNQFLLIDPYDPARGQITVLGLISRITTNFFRYPSLILPLTLVPTLRHQIITMIVLVSVIIGVVRFAFRRNALVLYLAFHWGVLLMWPAIWSVTRMLLPLVPLLLFFFVIGIITIGDIIRRGWKILPQRTSIAIGILASILMISSNVPKIAELPLSYSKNLEHYLQACRWIEHNTKEKGTVLCKKPYLAYLISGKETVEIFKTRDRTAFIKKMIQARVRYAIVDTLPVRGTPQYLIPAINKYTSLFTLLYKTSKPSTFVVKFKWPYNGDKERR